MSKTLSKLCPATKIYEPGLFWAPHLSFSMFSSFPFLSPLISSSTLTQSVQMTSSVDIESLLPPPHPGFITCLPLLVAGCWNNSVFLARQGSSLVSRGKWESHWLAPRGPGEQGSDPAGWMAAVGAVGEGVALSPPISTLGAASLARRLWNTE